MTKSTRGDWRVLVTVGMAVLLASMVGVASQAATDKACVKGCKSEKAICFRFFNGALKTARSECEALTGAARRQCIAAIDFSAAYPNSSMHSSKAKSCSN